MLIEQSYKPGDVCSIKLITGDEIVAKFINQSNGAITIQHPLALSVAMDPETQQPQLQMLPSFLLSARRDTKIKIDLQHVIAMGPSEDAAKTAYESNINNINTKR